MSGFVYIWYDRKHKRYYIGSHWGSENDGYICSSKWMKQAYSHRPHDFKRRIVFRNAESRAVLLAEEQRWLEMIKIEEMSGNGNRFPRYYNLNRGRVGHWTALDNSKTIAQKISDAHADPEIKEKHRARVKSGLAAMSDEAKAEKVRKFRETRATPESFAKASASQKAAIKDYKNGRGGLFKEGHATWNKGTKGVMRAWNKGATGVSEETSRRMSESARARGPGPAQKGRIWVNDGTRNVKLPAGMTEIPDGFQRGMMPKLSRWDRVNTPNEETTT